MSVNLTPRVENLVRQKVAAGPYRSDDEVIEEALQALDERARLNWESGLGRHKQSREFTLDSGRPRDAVGNEAIRAFGCFERTLAG